MAPGARHLLSDPARTFFFPSLEGGVAERSEVGVGETVPNCLCVLPNASPLPSSKLRFESTFPSWGRDSSCDLSTREKSLKKLVYRGLCTSPCELLWISG